MTATALVLPIVVGQLASRSQVLDRSDFSAHRALAQLRAGLAGQAPP